MRDDGPSSPLKMSLATKEPIPCREKLAVGGFLIGGEENSYSMALVSVVATVIKAL